MIKKNVLEGFSAENLLITTIVTTMLAAILIGLYFYAIYRFTTKSGFYSRGFNKSLAVLPVITSGILLAMQGSLVISLGMVGALSIVCFRNELWEQNIQALLEKSFERITASGAYERTNQKYGLVYHGLDTDAALLRYTQERLQKLDALYLQRIPEWSWYESKKHCLTGAQKTAPATNGQVRFS